MINTIFLTSHIVAGGYEKERLYVWGPKKCHRQTVAKLLELQRTIARRDKHENGVKAVRSCLVSL